MVKWLFFFQKTEFLGPTGMLVDLLCWKTVGSSLPLEFIASMQWEASVGWNLSVCICNTESRYGWYLSSQHLRLDSADHNQSPSGSPFCYLFVSALEANPRIMAGGSVCLFSVAAHSVSLTTHFDLTSFHAIMVHFGNIHHEQREIP